MRGCVEWVCSVAVLCGCEFGSVFKAHGGGEGGREGGRERGREGERERGRVGRPCLFDPIITSGTNAQDQIRSGGGERTRTATPRNNRLAGLRIQTYNF